MKRIIIILFVLLSSCSTDDISGPYVVENVVDGDTLDISLGRIRLSGINTPETGECYYEEAKEKLKELTLGKEVYIERDIENYDKYSRMLRYIYVGNLSVNGYLVENGYAKVYDKYNETTSRYYELKYLEEKTKENNLGVWSCVDVRENCLYVASKFSDVYHTPTCKWAKKIKEENLICFKTIEETEGYEFSGC